MLRCSKLIIFLGLSATAIGSGVRAQTNEPEASLVETKEPLPISGKLRLTGGVSQVEGSAGGGLTPWAVIGGYGTQNQIGANLYYTNVSLTDFNVASYGGLVSIKDRIEFSASEQVFDTQDIGAALGLGQGYKISQTTYGIKLKVLGDAVIDQDRLLPQISVGAQFKANDRKDLVKALGARDADGIDYYISATKLLLSHSALLNLTLRATKANQFGILGFGGIDNDYHLQPEVSLAYLVRKDLAIGVEARSKPDNLGVAHENAAFDAFVAYAPTKNISITTAYADLGNIIVGRQHGLYVSLQAGF